MNANLELRGGVQPKPGQALDIVQQRASSVRYISAPSFRSISTTVGNEPLCVDLVGPLTGTHWALSLVNASGVFLVNPLPAAGGPPVAGLHLVPDGSAPIESLSDAQAGINAQARGIPLPVDWTIVALGVGKGYAYVCQARLNQFLIVPNGWTIRFLANLNPGQVNPGPGVGSTAIVQAWGAVERDLS